MKKAIGMLAFFAIIVMSFVAATPAVAVGTLVAVAPLATQKAVFLNSLKEEYEKIDTWLTEAQDLSSFVTDAQTIKFPEGGADPAVYKDRTTDVDSVEPTETVHSEDLNVYDSQNYKIRNIFLHALPFDKIQFYTEKSAKAIRKQVVKDAAFNLMPAEITDNDKRLAIGATGAAKDGRKTLVLADILTLAERADAKEFPDTGRNLVLPSDMWWSLVSSNDILKAQITYQQSVGVIEPRVVEYYGIKIHKSTGTDKMGIRWDVSSNKRAAQDAVLSGTVAPCALFFCSEAVYRADGEFKMFYTPMAQNPTGRAEEFGFQHRQKSGHQFANQKYTGVIYLPNA